MASLKWQGLQKSSLQSSCATPRSSSSVPPAVPSPSPHGWRPGTKANGFSAGLIVSPCCTAWRCPSLSTCRSALCHYSPIRAGMLHCLSMLWEPIKGLASLQPPFQGQDNAGKADGAVPAHVSAAVLAEHFL